MSTRNANSARLDKLLAASKPLTASKLLTNHESFVSATFVHNPKWFERRGLMFVGLLGHYVVYREKPYERVRAI
jgi:hypothetical protein